MTSSRTWLTSSRTWLPIAAVPVTVGLAWLAARGSQDASIMVGLSLPLFVPAIWVAVALGEPWHRRGWPAAAVTLVLGLLTVGATAGLVLGGYLLAGGAVGTLWRWRWRVLSVLGVGAICLVPGFFLGLGGQSVPEAFSAWGDELRAQHEAGLPEDLPVSERAAAVTAYEERLDATLAIQRRLWPSLVAVGLVAQTALVLLVGRGLARLTGGAPPQTAGAAFVVWRAPFMSVWLLIGGLAASLAPVGRGLNDLGWNLVLAASMLLVVQGLAVQAWLVRRLVPPLGRTFYWVLGFLFFAPVLVGSGLLVGLADQWWDLRRLRRPPGQDAEKT